MSKSLTSKHRSDIFSSQVNRMIMSAGDETLAANYMDVKKIWEERPDARDDVIEIWLTQIITKIVGMGAIEARRKAEWISTICMLAKHTFDQQETMNGLGLNARTMLIEISKHICTSGSINSWGIQLLANSCRAVLREASVKHYVAFTFPDKEAPISIVLQKVGESTPQDRVKTLEEAIRAHRDTEGEDRCHLIDDALYAVLPEGKGDADTRMESPTVTLGKCIRYISCHLSPTNDYRSHMDEIRELREQVESVKQENTRLKKLLEEAPW